MQLRAVPALGSLGFDRSHTERAMQPLRPVGPDLCCLHRVAGRVRAEFTLAGERLAPDLDLVRRDVEVFLRELDERRSLERRKRVDGIDGPELLSVSLLVGGLLL